MWMLVACFFATTIAVVHSGTHIVGNISDPHAYPWMVHLRHAEPFENNNYDDPEVTGSPTLKATFCGGALIKNANNQDGSDLVITAAHCVTKAFSTSLGIIQTSDPIALDEFVAIVGDHNASRYDEGEQVRTIKRMVIHPGWKPEQSVANDIAIVQMREAVKFEIETIQAINLHWSLTDQAKYSFCTVTGWGQASDANPNASEVLRAINVTIQDKKACIDIYRPMGTEFFTNKTLCVGINLNGKVCMGDSGSGLACMTTDGQWNLRGIVSVGAVPSNSASMCENRGIPDLYTDILAYQDWIEQTIKNIAVTK